MLVLFLVFAFEIIRIGVAAFFFVGSRNILGSSHSAATDCCIVYTCELRNVFHMMDRHPILTGWCATS
jgi:hypothetical protein